MSDNLKGIVVGVRLDDINKSVDEEKFNSEMNELIKLAEACNIEILETVTQSLPDFNNKTYVGKGKVDEIKQISEALEVDVVIFNDELTPSQIKNINDLEQQYQTIKKIMENKWKNLKYIACTKGLRCNATRSHTNE